MPKYAKLMGQFKKRFDALSAEDKEILAALGFACYEKCTAKFVAIQPPIPPDLKIPINVNITATRTLPESQQNLSADLATFECCNLLESDEYEIEFSQICP